MKKYLLRIENLLLLLLALYPFIFRFLFFNTTQDIHMHDTYFDMHPNHHNNGFNLAFIVKHFYFLGFAAYILHPLIRLTNKRQKLICNMHIFLSITLLIALLSFIAIYPNALIIYKNISMPIITGYSLLPKYELIFGLIQIAFIVYGLITLLKLKKSQ
jgi:hypothetical protein